MLEATYGWQWEGYNAPPELRDLRELLRHRAVLTISRIIRACVRSRQSTDLGRLTPPGAWTKRALTPRRIGSRTIRRNSRMSSWATGSRWTLKISGSRCPCFCAESPGPIARLSRPGSAWKGCENNADLQGVRDDGHGWARTSDLSRVKRYRSALRITLNAWKYAGNTPDAPRSKLC